MGWKRLSIVTWVVGYIGVVGVPVWWNTTRVERPVFKPGTRPFFESLPESTPDLPVTFHITIITHDGSTDFSQDGGTAPLDGGSAAECGVGAAEVGRCAGLRQSDAQALDVEALKVQLQRELLSAGASGDASCPIGKRKTRSRFASEVTVDTMHLTRTSCVPPGQHGNEGARCGGPVSVPCAAAPLLTAPPRTGSAAAAQGTGPFRGGTAASAAHVRRIERALSVTHGAQHGAAPCPGTHRILVIVAGDRCSGGGEECRTVSQISPSTWIGPARTSYVWLGGSDIAAGLSRATGGIIRVIMHGVRASDLQPMHQPAADGGGWTDVADTRVLAERDMEGSLPRKLPLSAASELSAVFTMAVAEPEAGNLPEGIGRDVEVAWGALVQRLAPIAHIRLESQARLYARARLVHAAPPLPPAATDAGNATAPQGVTVPPEALPFFVDSDAWALEHGRMIAGHAHPLSPDPHGIPESVLHFVGYVPSPAERPMRVECSSGACHGFKIADWGGLTMLNSVDTRADVPLFLGTAMQQFRELLGLAPAADWVVSATGAGVAGGGRHRRERAAVAAELGAVAVVSPESEGVALWEVDWLARQRYVQLMHETGAAVTALMDLVSSLESLEIPAFIGSKIESAMMHAEQAVLAGREGDYQFAMQEARAGRVDAEVALTHHTIASQHSYPFQHKIAVYLPLFAPLSLPIIAAVFVELKRRIRQ